MKTWDVIIVGGGIIGISLSLSMRKQGATVLIIEKGEPGREASHAAAGMLAHCEQPEPVRELSRASSRMYPQFVLDIEDESDLKVDYRSKGTILLFSAPKDEPSCDGAIHLTSRELAEMEPSLSAPIDAAMFFPESSVDPRALTVAALKAARHRGIDISSGDEVTAIEVETVPKMGVIGVETTKTRFPTRTVVNCAGAWSSSIASPLPPPTRPVKGHMLDLVPAPRLLAQGEKSSNRLLVEHVIRSPEVYLVPRSDGRLIVGSTLEDVGFDKRIDADTIQTLFQSAANICPELGEAKIHDTWTGLRPGTPDNLPVLGATGTPGYYVATGHFRDGILLAPITAQLMTQVIQNRQPELDISAFSPLRFQ